MNDLAISAKYLIDSGHCSRVLILDLDVHQGDGTAKILEDRSDIFTCSFHAARNFPEGNPTFAGAICLRRHPGDGLYWDLFKYQW